MSSNNMFDVQDDIAVYFTELYAASVPNSTFSTLAGAVSESSSYTPVIPQGQPDVQPQDQPDAQSQDQRWVQFPDRPDIQLQDQLDAQPPDQRWVQFPYRPDVQLQDQPDAQPQDQLWVQFPDQPVVRLQDQTDAQPQEKPDAQPQDQPDAESQDQQDAQDQDQPDAQADEAEAPYGCPVCAAKFGRVQERNRHIESHLPHSMLCLFQTCTWTGRRQWDFKEHWRRKHTEAGQLPKEYENEIYDPKDFVTSIVGGTPVDKVARSAFAKVQEGLRRLGKPEVGVKVLSRSRDLREWILSLNLNSTCCRIRQ